MRGGMSGRVAVPRDGSGTKASARGRVGVTIDTTDAGATPDMGPEQPSSGASLASPGARIGQYEIIRELGQGGMGTVYAARDTKLGRKVAIKLIAHTNHPESNARFIIEAKATAQCSHENIVVIHEVGEHGGAPFMVLEYLQGVPLTQLLQDGRKLPPAQAIELIVPVVRALTVAHAHDIVHRDLKPDNIFVTDAGHREGAGLRHRQGARPRRRRGRTRRSVGGRDPSAHEARRARPPTRATRT